MDGKAKHILRITKIKTGSLSLQVEGVSYNSLIYQFSFPSVKGEIVNVNLPKHLSDTYLEILYLSYDKDHIKLVIGKIENNWRGAIIFISENNGQSYKAIANVNQSSIYGFIVNHLGQADESNEVEVMLNYGELFDADDLSILNGANLALVGDEIIQFHNAKLISKNRYRLSKLLRGKFGTGKYVSDHQKGERFILLDESIINVNIKSSMIGKSLFFKAVTYGKSINNTKAVKFTVNNNLSR